MEEKSENSCHPSFLTVYQDTKRLMQKEAFANPNWIMLAAPPSRLDRSAS
jgi:hypothetical protein